MKRFGAVLFACFLSARGLVGRAAGVEPGLTYDEAVALARAYMEQEDEVRRQEILARVAGWDERLDDIAAALRPVPPDDAPVGHIMGERFSVPRLREIMDRLVPRADGPAAYLLLQDEDKHPAPDEEYLNWLYVPEEYDPARAFGLVIRLHGGIGSVPQSAARLPAWSYRARPGIDVITVGPGTPPMRGNKFSFPESETHFGALIEEISARYHIDPDRVFLVGGSMGGIGCWWHAARQSDRFAVIAPMAMPGPAGEPYYPGFRGTLICSVFGAYDTRLSDDTRCNFKRMREWGLEFVDAEYPAGHPRSLAMHQIDTFYEFVKTVRRDPYPPRVAHITPWTYPRWGLRRRADQYPPQPYSFWLSIEEIGDGGVPVGLDPQMRLEDPPQVSRPGNSIMRAGAAEAENLGGNRFRVRTTNVRRFALWLHPDMGVDFQRPVNVEVRRMQVNEEARTETEAEQKTVVLEVRPSLGAMLRYLGARRDYGLIYHAVVEVETEP